MTAFPLATPSLRTVRNAAAKLPPASAYIFAVAAGNGFSLLTIPLMAHRLSPASFGELDVAVSVVEFIGLFMTLGIAETCIRFSQESGTAGPETQSMPAAILGAAAALALLLGCAIQLFLGRIAGAIGITADPIALRVAVAGSCATALIEMPLIWLRLRGRPWRYLTFVSARAAVQAAATVTVLLAGGGAAGLLLSNGLLMLGFAGALSVFQIRETGIRFALAPFPLIARYGFPLVGGLLAMFALGNCDRWFLSGRVPSAEIAYYGLAAKLALVTAVVYQPFLLWWSARRLSMLWEKDGPAKLGKAWGHGTGLLTLSALIVALAAPSFISAVFPDSYRKAIDYLPLLVLISVLNELCSLSNTGVYATDHGFRVLAVNGIGAATAMAGLCDSHSGARGDGRHRSDSTGASRSPCAFSVVWPQCRASRLSLGRRRSCRLFSHGERGACSAGLKPPAARRLACRIGAPPRDSAGCDEIGSAPRVSCTEAARLC